MKVDDFLSGNYRHDPHYPVGVSARDFVEPDRDEDDFPDVDLRVEPDDEDVMKGAEYEEGAS